MVIVIALWMRSSLKLFMIVPKSESEILPFSLKSYIFFNIFLSYSDTFAAPRTYDAISK